MFSLNTVLENNYAHRLLVNLRDYGNKICIKNQEDNF